VAKRISRRAFVGAAGAGIAGAAGAGIALDRLVFDDRSSSAAEPAAGGDERRNVVVIMIDSLRADHVGAYGAEGVRTPNLDALARESMRFTNCFPEAMPTVPTRRTVLTGKRAWPFFGWEPWDGMAARAGWEPIDPGTDTIVKALRRQGWWTGMVTDNPFLGFTTSFEPVRQSPDRFVRVLGQRGDRNPPESVPEAEALRRLPDEMHEEQFVYGVRKYLANNGYGSDAAQSSAARVFRSAGKALAEAAGQPKPFFLYVDSFDPHEPWAAPPEYMELYTDRGRVPIADVLYRGAGYMDADEIETLAAGYKAEVTMMDRWLGHFLDRFYELGLDDSTVVALVSDHGVYVGERNWTGKGDKLLHPELTHVPLLVRDPDGRGSGESSDWWATTVDIPATVMSIAGAVVPPGFDGVDVTPILEGGAPDADRPYGHGGYSNFSFVRDERWVYIAANDRSYEVLFDKRADPGEERDVSADNPERVREMWARVVEQAGGREPPMYSEADWDAEPRTSFAGG
jgi:arylsulfatase A-like enzyme